MSPFLAELLQCDRFVLTTHLRGDGDAVGSTIALAMFLRAAGKETRIICPDAVSPNLEWLPGIDELDVYVGSINQMKAIASADALVVVDTNAAKRIGALADAFQHADAKRVLVDHHPTPEKWFDLIYQRDDASSTGELVCELIDEFEAEEPVKIVDHDVATLLYTAIMTDTGSFRFSNVTPKVHRHIADLIERGGIVPDEIHTELYDRRSLTSLRLLGLALERIDLRYDGRLGFLALSRQFMRDAGGERGDTEGLVNYILSVEGVRVAVFFLETDRGTKISFRSQGDVAVNKWAAAFGGGGHRNASGAFVKGFLDDVVDRVLESASKHVEFLSAKNDPHNDAGRPDEAELSDDDANYLSALLNPRSSR